MNAVMGVGWGNERTVKANYTHSIVISKDGRARECHVSLPKCNLSRESCVSGGSGSGGSMKDLCIQRGSQRVSDLLDGMPLYAGPHTQL